MPTCPCFQLFSMNFLAHLALTGTSGIQMARRINNLAQFELVVAELCPKNRPNFINMFSPSWSQLARCLHNFSRPKCRITLETSSTSHIRLLEYLPTVRAAQEIHENMAPNLPKFNPYEQKLPQHESACNRPSDVRICITLHTGFNSEILSRAP